MQKLVTACKANLLGLYCTVDRTEYAGRQAGMGSNPEEGRNGTGCIQSTDWDIVQYIQQAGNRDSAHKYGRTGTGTYCMQDWFIQQSGLGAIRKQDLGGL
jgi:hypothetical protein